MNGDKNAVKPRAGEEDAAVIVQSTEKEYYPQEDPSFYEDALCYQPTACEHLREMIEYLDLSPNDVFVDLGCGKGRIVCFLAQENIKKVVGVELRRELTKIARENVGKIRTVAPVEIREDDCATFYSEDGTVFYMFNAFGRDTVKRVLVNIKDSIDANPREVRIVYNNCVHRECLDDAEWLIREGRIGRTGILVWRSRALYGIPGMKDHE